MRSSLIKNVFNGAPRPVAFAPTYRGFSVLNRPSPNYPGHVPLTSVEKGILAIGSAVGAIIDPYRHGKPFSSRALSETFAKTSII